MVVTSDMEANVTMESKGTNKQLKIHKLSMILKLSNAISPGSVFEFERDDEQFESEIVCGLTAAIIAAMNLL